MPSPLGADASPILDPEVLEELTLYCDPETLHRLVDTFAECAPEQLSEASDGLRTGNLQATARAIHSMRSGIGSLGLRRLAPLAQQIETQATQRHPENLDALLARLGSELSLALDALRRYLADHPAP